MACQGGFEKAKKMCMSFDINSFYIDVSLQNTWRELGKACKYYKKDVQDQGGLESSATSNLSR